MLPNKNHGRFRVTEEGTLIIESVRSEDAGEDACHGESLAGRAYAKARLDIKGQINIVQYNTVEYSTAQHSAIQYSTVQCSTVKYIKVKFSSVQYNTIQCNTMQCNT